MMDLTKVFMDGVTLGRTMQREIIIAHMLAHLAVCNFQAVNEEACDVCHYLRGEIDWIREQQTAGEETK
jgi:hypothetical protein